MWLGQQEKTLLHQTQLVKKHHLNSTRKVTVHIPQNIKFILARNKRSPRPECKYAVKTNRDNPKISNLEHFPLYLECQINHYEVDVLEKSTFKPIPHSSWIKNNTQQLSPNQNLFRKNPFPLIEKENLTDGIILPEPSDLNSKYAKKKIF